MKMKCKFDNKILKGKPVIALFCTIPSNKSLFLHLFLFLKSLQKIPSAHICKKAVKFKKVKNKPATATTVIELLQQLLLLALAAATGPAAAAAATASRCCCLD